MKRILIVEDRETGRELLRTVLEKEGYIVVEARDGGEAIQKAQELPPDLILLDLHLPLRDGFQVLTDIRRDHRLTTIPVLAVTASAMQGDREKTLAAGFNGYLAKPVSLVNLREEITRLLQVVK
ncbi:MAG TPA: response regulator [Candidatus Angelobacter sp.]|jgi:CheY-like chemotaxis protein|nr:response regulator [Candidatus Angelobacter sp.]